MKLNNSVAIVTGGGQGIGRAISLLLAKNGADVVIADIDVQTATNVADKIKSLGRQANALKCDVSNSQQVKRFVSETLKSFGKIDILVNNAGIPSNVPSIELTEAEWDSVIDINLKGTFLFSQVVGRQMIRQRRGKIVNLSSLAGHRGAPCLAAYSASKGGIIQLTQVLAVEWGKYNINVNAVSPGMTTTPLFENMEKKNPNLLKDRLRSIPLKRANSPEDVAKTVLFLASPESDNISGQVIIVDGGICALHPGIVSAIMEESLENS
jgi:NAD(P)-dependent dehydrogenase (short-subunit alcohol dehydrogenase family)